LPGGLGMNGGCVHIIQARLTNTRDNVFDIRTAKPAALVLPSWHTVCFLG
jgi:hypothetical protein